MRICCDIDGVLADVRKYIKLFLPHDWSTYLSYTLAFPCIEPMGCLIRDLVDNEQNDVYFVTGRPESNREPTVVWLRLYVIAEGVDVHLLMRPDHDPRSNCDVKMDWFRSLKPDLIIDDDPKVAEVAVQEGFVVLQPHGFRATENDMIPFNKEVTK